MERPIIPDGASVGPAPATAAGSFPQHPGRGSRDAEGCQSVYAQSGFDRYPRRVQIRALVGNVCRRWLKGFPAERFHAGASAGFALMATGDGWRAPSTVHEGGRRRGHARELPRRTRERGTGGARLDRRRTHAPDPDSCRATRGETCLPGRHQEVRGRSTPGSRRDALSGLPIPPTATLSGLCASWIRANSTASRRRVPRSRHASTSSSHSSGATTWPNFPRTTSAFG
ncbi:hypothetical protein CI41S_20320 [Bradyrhizobium ivorense]|nr:hypothetical protein CI41S_20320 [Bradyrhizobium ivorense]